MVLRVPRVNIGLSSAGGEIQLDAPRTLIIGQKLASGTAVANAITADIPNSFQYEAMFGKGSMLERAVKVFKSINTQSPLDVIALDDLAAGTQATATLTVTGTASVTNEIDLYIGSRLNGKVTVVVPATSTATATAGLIVTAITARPELGLTATSAAGVVTLTYVHKGSEGNQFSMEVVQSNAVQNVVLTAFTGGAGNPSVAAAIALIATLKYDTIVIPASYDPTPFVTDLEGKFNTQYRDYAGVLFQVSTDTISNAIITLNTFNAKTFAKGYMSPCNTSTKRTGNSHLEQCFVVAAGVAAIDMLRLTQGSDLTDLVIAPNAPLERIGGPARSALPYHNTPLDFLLPEGRGAGFNETNIEDLYTAGGWTVSDNIRNTNVLLSQIKTTFKYDPQGNPDQTFENLGEIRTSTLLRQYVSQYFRQTYAQTRLTDGQIAPFVNMVNKQVIEADMIQLRNLFAGVDFLWTEDSQEARSTFNKNLRVTIDKANKAVNIIARFTIVTSLESFNIDFTIALTDKLFKGLS